MLKDIVDKSISDEVFRERYKVTDSRDWKLSKCRNNTISEGIEKFENSITECLYRPFDRRWIILHDNFVTYPRWETTKHFQVSTSLGFATTRQTLEEISFFPSTVPFGQHKTVDPYNRSYIFPLHIYPDVNNPQKLFFEEGPRSNLSQVFLNAVREKLSYIPTPEAIFYYIYAIFHSLTYRQRYAEFLKVDFPRVPLTSNDELFRALGEKGQTLVELHLMKSKKLNKVITKFPVSGDNAVTEVTYKSAEQQVYINKIQYFEGIVPEVWLFKIGGYQVLDKWLKDRKKAKRSLSFDDVLHYQRVVVALKETMQVMDEIDQLIPSWPLE